METYQVIAAAITILTFYFMLRRDFRASISEVKAEMKEFRAEIKGETQSIRQEMKEENRNILNLIIAIKDEMKDFHGRLIALETKKEMEKNQ